MHSQADYGCRRIRRLQADPAKFFSALLFHTLHTQIWNFRGELYLQNCGAGLLRLVPNIIMVPSSPLTHFYFEDSTLNALYNVCMPCQNTCKMGSELCTPAATCKRESSDLAGHQAEQQVY